MTGRKKFFLCPHTCCEDVSFLFNVAESAGAVTCSTHIPPFPRIASVTDDGGAQIFLKLWEPRQNSRRQKGDMKPVPH